MAVNTRAAFYDLPADLANRTGREKLNRASSSKLVGDSSMSSGSSTPSIGPTNGMVTPEALAQQLPEAYAREKIDYEQYPLTPLGQLLVLCMSCGIASYPHPGVPLQFFEIAVRYADFWKSRNNAIQPMLEAMLDSR
jgi:exportin-T